MLSLCVSKSIIVRRSSEVKEPIHKTAKAQNMSRLSVVKLFGYRLPRFTVRLAVFDFLAVAGLRLGVIYEVRGIMFSR